ncbi:MAG: Ig-like domain-containing protein, partial [Actinomycetota bacterium]
GSTVIDGTSPAGTRTARIYDDATLIGTAAPNDAGDWSTSLSFAPRQPKSITATGVNLCGEGLASVVRSFTVTSVRPTIATPAANSFLSTTSPPVGGTAEPGATIDISEAGTPLATLSADGTGAWSVPIDLSEGPHTLTATATIGGFTSLPATRSFTLDVTAPLAPTIASPADGSTLEPTVTFSGQSEPLSRVVVVSEAGTVGQATTNAAGAWTLPAVLDVGVHTLSAHAVDRAANVGPDTAPITLTIIDPLKILSPAEGGTYPGNVQFDVVTSPAAVELIIFDNGVAIARKPVAGRRFKGIVPLGDGVHSITVQTRASDNSLSAVTNARTFTVDATAPTVTVSGLGGTMLTLIPGMSLSGSATDPGTTPSGVTQIKISYTGVGGGHYDQVATCTGCTGANVTWTASPSAVIHTAGVYNVVVYAADAVGNTSGTQRTQIIVL